jgi:hypothetical protein
MLRGAAFGHIATVTISTTLSQDAQGGLHLSTEGMISGAIGLARAEFRAMGRLA